MRFDVISLFPSLINSFFEYGVIGKALRSKKIVIQTWNPRDFLDSNNSRVDDRPYGGGPGMVLLAKPLIDTIEEAKKNSQDPYVILMSPQGKVFESKKAKEWALKKHLVIVCGRYEGVDQRVIKTIVDEECSIGDFVVSGGEIPALLVVDSVSRLLEGILGDPESSKLDSFSKGLLKHPQYTRPEEGPYGNVPKVLLSGDHALIRLWQLKQSLLKTRKVRPDLLDKRQMNKEEKELLDEIISEEKD